MDLVLHMFRKMANVKSLQEVEHRQVTSISVFEHCEGHPMGFIETISVKNLTAHEIYCMGTSDYYLLEFPYVECQTQVF